MNYKLAVIGFGVVGQGLTEILRRKKELLKKTYDVEFSIVAISDTLKGAVYNQKGLDPAKLLSLVEQHGRVDGYPEGIKGWDSLKTIRESNADIIIEVTYTDVKTGEPAISHCKAAFETGKHVVTTNKGPVALAYRELSNLAAEKGLFFKFEGTVMSGTPVLSTATKSLAGCDIQGFKGILNGTTNYILTEMEKGKPYEQVLKRAQELGYAEADPSGDVEGWDALAKVIILANVVMGGNLKLAEAQREGITKISLRDMETAKNEGCRWKLIGEAKRENGKLKANVSPRKLSLTDPLANVMGATNAITFETDLMGPITIVGAGAGKIETGFSLLTDLLDIHRSLYR